MDQPALGVQPPFPITHGVFNAPKLVLAHTCAQLRQVFLPEQVEYAKAFLDSAYDMIDSWPARYRPMFYDSHAIVLPEHLGDDGVRLIDWIDGFIRNSAMIDVIEAVLGGSPTAHRLSIRLRRHRSEKMTSFVPWHQDLCFLGQSSSYLNCWVPLTDCGPNAPALDLIPRRPDVAFPIEDSHDNGYGMGGIDPAELTRHFGEEAIWTPQLEVGDCLLFDSSCLHRTSRLSSGREGRMSFEIRYSLET